MKTATLTMSEEWPVFECHNPKCGQKFTIGLIIKDAVYMPSDRTAYKWHCPYCGKRPKAEAAPKDGLVTTSAQKEK